MDPALLDAAYADLHARFLYLQQTTHRLSTAYSLATQELEDVEEDTSILKAKLVQIRVRRRGLAAQAEVQLSSNMTAKSLFCRRTRLVMRKQFPLVSRSQLSTLIEGDWDALPKDAHEVRLCVRPLFSHMSYRNGNAISKPTCQSQSPKPKR